MKITMFVSTSSDLVFIFNDEYFSDQSWYFDYKRRCFEQAVDWDYLPIQNKKRFWKILK